MNDSSPERFAPHFAFCVLQFALCIAFVFVATGCNTQPTPLPDRYRGPTESLPQLVSNINKNNAQIPSLWARHSFEGTIVDDKGQSHFVNATGVILYRGPREIRMVASKPGVDVFEIGSTPDRYWLKIVPEANTMWWGWYRNVAKPCAGAMPIRPDLVGEVLGLAALDVDLMHEPAPVLRYNNDFDVYMLVFQSRSGDHWAATKEIWYDRATHRPVRVFLFDPNGRVVLRANLSDHQPVEVDSASRENWPVMATKFRLYFPDTGTKMNFDLSDMALTHRGVPNPRSIRFPEEAQSNIKVVQIDADCDR